MNYYWNKKVTQLKQLIAFVTNDLWLVDVDRLPWYQRYAVSSLKISIAMLNVITSGMLTLRAMSLVYTTLLSLVPLIAVSFSVLKGFGVHNQIEPMLANLLAPLGTKGDEITTNILMFVNNMKVGVLGAMGLGMLLYTVVSLIQKIESAFNDVWKITRKRSLARRFSDYLSVLMVGPVLVFSAIGVTATAMNSSVVQSMMAIEPFGTLILFFSKLLPYLFVIAAFTFIYVFVPNTKVRLRSAIVGAVVSGVLWETTGILFASFVAGSTKYAAIYSGFAILIIFMIWLYLSWLILLFGAHVVFYHQNPEQLRANNEPLILSNRHKEQLSLLIISSLLDAWHHGNNRLTLKRFVEMFHLPEEAVLDLIDSLRECNLIAETADDEHSYILAVDPEQITLSDILQVIRSDKEESYHLNLDRISFNKDVLTAIDHIDLSDIRHKNLKELLLSK